MAKSNPKNKVFSEKWRGELKQEYFKYRFFYYTLKIFGLKFSYFILSFVVFFYVVFNKKARDASLKFFEKLDNKNQSFLIKLKNTYLHFFTFGQTLLDRTYISLGLKNPFTVTYSSREKFLESMKSKEGVLLICSHMGNFELAGFLMQNLSKPLYLMMLQIHDPKTREFLNELREKRGYEIIDLEEPMQATLKAVEELKKGSCVSVMGDRDIQKKSVKLPFLSGEGKFPIAPFLLPTYASVPVFFIWCFKEKNSLYKVFTYGPYHPPQATNKEERYKAAEDLLKEYVSKMEELVKQYPYQWFNFFEFWDE